MKTAILILAIYLVGAVLAYTLLRKYSKKNLPEYTIAERVLNLRYSVLSWMSVIIALLLFYDDWHTKNKNNPAKW